MRSLLNLWTLAVTLFWFVPPSAVAQNTELDTCLLDTLSCAESSLEFLSESCGERFYFQRGRLSWPPLIAVGPITIEVLTRSYYAQNTLPLFVELVVGADSLCSTNNQFAFSLVVTNSLGQCGGVWQSIGPIDITRFTPLGRLYRIQVEFFEGPPVIQARSPGLACIRVKLADPQATSRITWAGVKEMFR